MRRWAWLAAPAAALALVVLLGAAAQWRQSRSRPLPIGLVAPAIADEGAAARAAAAWNGERAMDDIRALLPYAPRSPGTPGQASTLAYIDRSLRSAGAFEIRRQSWTHRREDGVDLPLTNVIARWEPARKTRVLAGTHHDSLVRAFRDPAHPDAPMPGANNSASGVALLLETARALSAGGVRDAGVDFVFFDGEEGQDALAGQQLPWSPLGSTHFVDQLKEFYPERPPVAVAVFDLVCRTDLRLSPEANSLEAAAPEVRMFWALGTKEAPQVFTADPAGRVYDDHTPFLNAGLRAFLVIDFRRTPWFNTTADTIDKCSAESLSAVGRTLIRYLHVDR
jgi:glutaminyl-peptide cyclotransferase